MSSFGFSTTATHCQKPHFAAPLQRSFGVCDILFCVGVGYPLRQRRNYIKLYHTRFYFARPFFIVYIFLTITRKAGFQRPLSRESDLKPRYNALCLHKLGRGWVSLRLGHARVLTPHRGVIHCARAASLPPGGGNATAAQYNIRVGEGLVSQNHQKVSLPLGRLIHH